MSREAICRRSIGGRADLLRALTHGRQLEVAEFLGYELRPSKPPAQPLQTPPPPPPPPPPPSEPQAEEPLFWRVVAYEGDVAEKAGQQETEATRWLEEAASTPEDDGWDAPPPIPPLGSFADVAALLRGAAARQRDGQDLDVDAALRRIADGIPLKRWPRRKRRRWGGELLLLFDKSERLTPYREDYLALYHDLKRLFPQGGVIPVDWRDQAPPPSGATVVVFSDLGLLSEPEGEESRAWAEYGERLRRVGGRGVAVLPAAPLRAVAQLSRVWSLIGWRRIGEPITLEEREKRLRQLQVLASPALSIEPGLLRGLRWLLGGRADPGLEGLFWQDAAVARRHPIGATPDVAAREALLKEFATLAPEERRDVLKLIYRWRFHPPRHSWRDGMRWVFAEECRSLPASSRVLVPARVRRSLAEDFLALAEAAEAEKASAGEMGWFWGLTHRLPLERWEDWTPDEAAERRAFMSLWRSARGDDPAAPPGYVATRVTSSDRPPRRFMIRQLGGRLRAFASEALSHGSLVCGITAREDDFALDSPPFWKDGAVPPFVSDFGCDKIGPWFEFAIEGRDGFVKQRLRWIPPGTFMMGSPNNEKGRDANEGPRHKVNISRGFWLFDTVCPNVLWEAVMREWRWSGAAAEPVVRVSLDHAQAFIDKLNALVPDSACPLPERGSMGIRLPGRDDDTVQLRRDHHSGSGELLRYDFLSGV